jgi:hypothetical protein
VRTAIRTILNRPSINLNYSTDGDANGLFYYLGSNKRSRPWQNPYGDKIIIVASSTDYGSSVNFLTDRRESDYYSNTNPGNWLDIDLAPSKCKLKCKYYSLQNAYQSANALRNWNFQGTNNNGITWDTLDIQVNNPNLKTVPPYQWLSLPLAGTIAYSRFRLIVTGLSALNGYILALSEIELYGNLTYN